jgi:hypothetical protein
MGSRIMHYCISAVLQQKLQIADNQFLLGGLAPDVHKYTGDPKEISHFLIQPEKGVRLVSPPLFYNKYLALLRSSPFHLGYYFHLISDEIWLKDVYFKKIKYLPPGIKEEALTQYYRDFGRLNGMLIDYYSMKLSGLDVEPVRIGEIDYTYLPSLIKDLEEDFQTADSLKGETLEILEWDEILQAMEHSITACMEAARGIAGGGGF